MSIYNEELTALESALTNTYFACSLRQTWCIFWRRDFNNEGSMRFVQRGRVYGCTEGAKSHTSSCMAPWHPNVYTHGGVGRGIPIVSDCVWIIIIGVHDGGRGQR